ncbi:unnamed protein product [Discosporangium mesarthrocarpum]
MNRRGNEKEGRRQAFKKLNANNAQESRRIEYLSRQSKARRDLTGHVRRLALTRELGAFQSPACPQRAGSSVALTTSLDHATASTPGTPRPLGEGMEVLDQEPLAAISEVISGVTSDDGSEGEDPGVGHDMQAEIPDVKGEEDHHHHLPPYHHEHCRQNSRRKSKRKGKRKGTKLEINLKARRDYWAAQLCSPEWMLGVPSDLNGKGSIVGEGWYVAARPEGKRVIVISVKGETVARQMNGAITHRFRSHLPGGSPSQAHSFHSKQSACYCILDCIYHELDSTFYVLDMMAWKGYPLYNCSAEFRLFWVRTKLQEATGHLGTVGAGNDHRIVAISHLECDLDGLRHAYSSPCPYIRDGLIFVLKQGYYQLGPSPLVLLWKDTSTTRYLTVEGVQTVVLTVGQLQSRDELDDDALHDPHGCDKIMNNGMGIGLPLQTSDGVILGYVGTTECVMEGTGEEGMQPNESVLLQAKPGDLLRFTLGYAEEESYNLVDAECDAKVTAIVKGLVFQKRCSPLRPMADTWSKILFQSRVRTARGVIFEDIASATMLPGSQIQPPTPPPYGVPTPGNGMY